MAKFVELDTCDELENGRRTKILLNLDRVVRFVETAESYCVAVFRTGGEGSSEGLTTMYITLPYGLSQIHQIILDD